MKRHYALPSRYNSLTDKRLSYHGSRLPAGMIAFMLVIIAGLFASCDMMNGVDWVEDPSANSAVSGPG
ncbi:MAG: hypothetical protein LBC60_06310, partial [Spirochaetaceae bacterium]|nr:hypothetical protein [Spirochaetaceae bacterium]